MKFQLFAQVALREDMPELNLMNGSIGTIVECYPASEQQENGYSLEGLIAQDTVEVSESQIEAIASCLPSSYSKISGSSGSVVEPYKRLQTVARSTTETQ